MTAASIDEFVQFVSSFIRCSDEKKVKEVINLSNRGGYMFHGIKRCSAYSQINENGLGPLTPEGGNVSFWSSGRRLFASGTSSPMDTYDTPFFHYAPSIDAPKNINCRHLAISQVDLLADVGINCDFKQDGYLTLSRAVPLRALGLVSVRINYDHESDRTIANSKGETIILEMIYDVLTEGRIPTRINIEETI